MIEAWQMYVSIPDDLRVDRPKRIAKLISEGEKIQLKMIEKAREAAAFDLPD